MDRRQIVVASSSLFGFIITILLIEFGFIQTLLIIFLTLISGLLGLAIDRNRIQLGNLFKEFFKK